MSPELKAVLNFCLEHAESAPVPKRLFLYRAMAEICATPVISAKLRAMATDLERADHLQTELAFQFQTPSAAKRKHPGDGDGHHNS